MEIIYRANDGKEFSTKDECIYHEEAGDCLKLFYKFFTEKEINTDYSEFLIEKDDECQYCDNVEDLFEIFLPYLRDFAQGNAVDECATPLGLLEYCLNDGGFGDICSIYIRDEDDNWILYDNWEVDIFSDF